MTKPKTLEQLRADKERAETQLAQEQHKLERLENRKKYTGNAVLPVLLLNTLFSTLFFLPAILSAEFGLGWLR